MFKRLIKNWLGLPEITTQISQIQADIYDNDALLNGFVITKFVEKKTILFAGKNKQVK